MDRRSEEKEHMVKDGVRWTMKVVEKFGELKEQIDKIEDRYCANCQEWDCSLCPYDYEGGEQDG